MFNDISKEFHIQYSIEDCMVKIVTTNFITYERVVLCAHMAIPIDGEFLGNDNTTYESVLGLIGYDNTLYAFIVTAKIGSITIER